MKKEFEEHLKEYLPAQEIEGLKSKENDSPYICILLDEEKISCENFEKEFPNVKKHPFSSCCYIVKKNEYDFGKHYLFEIGAYYILEPCAVLVNYFLNPIKSDLILDCCSAPGGKVIHSSFLLKNEGKIIANEINYQRCLTLSSNVEKYGRKNIIVTNMDLLSFPSSYNYVFDKIILDAPCSGSGMFRKEEKMLDDWSIDKVIKCSLLQKDLIIKAYSLLKEGGIMVYSTCSFSYQEDEEVIKHLMRNTDAEIIDIEDSSYFYKTKDNIGIHLFPHRFDGEGHYICVIKKPLNGENYYLKKKKEDIINLPFNYNGFIKKQMDNIYLSTFDEDISKLKVIRYGILLGSIDKKLGFIPHHNISRIKEDLLLSINLNLDETLSYLKGNPLNKNIKDGYYTLKYNDIPFAITKVSKNTLKNHYPKGLRREFKK